VSKGSLLRVNKHTTGCMARLDIAGTDGEPQKSLCLASRNPKHSRALPKRAIPRPASFGRYRRANALGRFVPRPPVAAEYGKARPPPRALPLRVSGDFVRMGPPQRGQLAPGVVEQRADKRDTTPRS